MSSLSNINEEDNCGPIFLSCLIKQNDETNDFSFSNGRVNIQKFPTNAPAIFDSAKAEPTKISWNIGNIDGLPDAANIFPLERTRVSVDHHLSPNVIGQRVCICLRDLSISIISKKGHKLFAESFDRDVRFYIKLYKEKYDGVRSDDDGESMSKYRVMVELQKRRGCAVGFGQMARTILQMAKSGHYKQENKEELFRTNENNSFPSLPHFQPKPTIVGANDVDSKIEKEVLAPYSCDLNRTAYLIRDNHMDASLLGMQDLAFLSNANTTNYATALRVGKLVLKEDEDGAGYDNPGFNVLIKSFICGNFYSEIDILDDSFEEWYYSRMHYYALTVLANAMHALSIFDGGLVYLQSIVSTDNWLEKKNGLLSVLIDELMHTEKQPHNAYQAMRCLNVLFQVSAPEAHMKAMEWGASNAIRKARNIGRSCYSLLANESELVMETSFTSFTSLDPGSGVMECAA